MVDIIAKKTTLEIVEARATELKPLYDRMDITKNLVYHTPYVMKDFDGETPVDNVINVTTNWPGVYANAIISDLMDSIWQTVIESTGKLSDKQKHDIEAFIDDNLAQADEQLEGQGMPDLFTWLCNHVCIRSLIGARWLTKFEKDGTYKVEALPVDMRWVPFEFGKNGLNWVAPKSYRSAAKILNQYGFDPGKEDNLVVDFWDGEKNEVWIEDKMAPKWPKKHNFGEPPFVIVVPATGFMLRDQGWIEHEAEDLLFLSRHLYEARSQQVSIEQTLALECLRPGVEQEMGEGGTNKADKPAGTGEFGKVKKGELHKLVPRGDISNAFRAGRADVQNMIEMGGPLLPRAYTQPPSAVEVQAEIELLKKWYYPRLKALSTFRKQLSRLMIDQYIKVAEKVKKGSSEIEIGAAGRKRKYTPQQLGDPGSYSINNQLMSQSKKQEIVNLAMFTATEGQLPLIMRLKDILKAEDPDGIMRALEIQKGKDAEPALGLLEEAYRYAQEAEELEGIEADKRKLESMMLTERCCVAIRQQQLAGQEPPQAEKGPEAKGGDLSKIMSLMGRGGGGGRPPTMEEEV